MDAVPDSLFLVKSSEKLVIAGLESKIDELELAWGDCMPPMIQEGDAVMAATVGDADAEPAPELDGSLVRQKVQTAMLLMAYLEPNAAGSIRAVLGAKYLVCFCSDSQFSALNHKFADVSKHHVITNPKQPLMPFSPADEFHVTKKFMPAGDRRWLVPDTDPDLVACYLFSRSEVLPLYVEELFSSIHPEKFPRPLLDSYVQFAQLGMRFCKYCGNFVTGALYPSNQSQAAHCITCFRFVRKDAAHRPLADLMLDPHAVQFVVAAHHCLRTLEVFETAPSKRVVSLAEVLAIDPRLVPKLLCRPALAVVTPHQVPQVADACSLLHLLPLSCTWVPKTLFEQLFGIYYTCCDSKNDPSPFAFALLNAAWKTISSKPHQEFKEHLGAIFDPELVSRFISIYDDAHQSVVVNPSHDPLAALTLFFRASVCAVLVHCAEQLFRDSEQQLELEEGVDLLAQYRASVIPAVDTRCPRGVADLDGMMAESWRDPSLFTLIVTRVAPLTPLLNSEHMELEDIIAAFPAGSLPCKIQVLSGKQFTRHVSRRFDLSQVQPPSAVVDFSARAELEHSDSPDLDIHFAALDRIVRSHSERLFATHANLQAIRSGLRRVGTKLVTNAPCIVLLVCGKGLIPWLDPSLPIELDGYPVDVREAVTAPLTRPDPGWESSAETGRHRVGARLQFTKSKSGPPKTTSKAPGYGTIGAYFVAMQPLQPAPAPLLYGTDAPAAGAMSVDDTDASVLLSDDGSQDLAQLSVSGSGPPTHLLSCGHVLQPECTFRFHDNTEIGHSPSDTITHFNSYANIGSFVDAGLLKLTEADLTHADDCQLFATPAEDFDRIILYKRNQQTVKAGDFPPWVSLHRGSPLCLQKFTLVFKVGATSGLSHGNFAELMDLKVDVGYSSDDCFNCLWKFLRVGSHSPRAKPKRNILKQVCRVVGGRWRFETADQDDTDHFSFGEAGDSGSLVFTSDGAAVGLVIRKQIEDEGDSLSITSGIFCQLEPAIATLERTMGNVSLQMLPIATSGFSNRFDFNATP